MNILYYMNMWIYKVYLTDRRQFTVFLFKKFFSELEFKIDQIKGQQVRLPVYLLSMITGRLPEKNFIIC